MLENRERTELSALGEFGLIEHLTKGLELGQSSSVLGIGDDAAVLDAGGENVLISSDMLVEGVHFDLTYAPLKHLGYKAVMVNLSDIYAMNGTPKQVLVNIAVSNRFSLEALEALYEGIRSACSRYEVDLVGGDTSSSRLGLVLSITAIGYAQKEQIVKRSGASDKELICVSGDLGAAYMGLQVLEREKSVFRENSQVQPDLEGYDYVLERQLKPEARKDVVLQLKEAGIRPTAMIDVSDGLASDLLHLCKASGLGCQLFEEQLPIDPVTQRAAEEFNLNPMIPALHGGEDYELLFTASLEDYNALMAMPGISIIGHMTEAEAGTQLVTTGGSSVDLQAQGWNAFSTNSPEHGTDQPK